MTASVIATVGGGLVMSSYTAVYTNRPLLKISTKGSSELGFVASQLSGMKISFNPVQFKGEPRVCLLRGKKSNRTNKVSHSNHKTKKLQFVNLQHKRMWWEAGKRYVKLRLSTKAIKTIEKNGLDAVAKKAGIDIRKE